MLCNYCSGFSIALIRGKHYVHQPSLKALRQSVQDGCEMCCHLLLCLERARPGESLPFDDEQKTTIWIRDYDDANRAHGRDHWKERIHVFYGPEIGNIFFSGSKLRPIGSLYLACEEGDPASHYLNGRIVDSDPCSDTTWMKITSWIQQCDSGQRKTPATHANCQHLSIQAMPTRTINVGPSDGSQEPYLDLTQDNIGDYVTLSYCWGQSNNVKTTRANIDDHKRAIPYHSLPPTIQDAITITRKLGKKFLWIDALCIIQDSLNDEDWQIESSKMADVYRNAYVTISAHAASNCSEGIFKMRPAQDPKPCKIAYCSPDGQSLGSVYVSSSDASGTDFLAARAWAFQEQKLSRRILRFFKNEATFICQSGTASESTGEKLGRSSITSTDRRLREALNPIILQASSLPPHEHLDDFLRKNWYTSIQNGYSHGILTREGDKLPAISGYAHEIHKYVGGKYLAGIWDRDIITGLLWGLGSLHKRLKKTAQKRCPSWSWAALDGPISCGSPFTVQKGHTNFKLIQHLVNSIGRDPMGQVSGGFLQVAGNLMKVAWSIRPIEFAWEERGTDNWQLWDYLLSLEDFEPSPTLFVRYCKEFSAGESFYKRLIGHCLFDTDENERPNNLWCLLVSTDYGLVLDYSIEEDAYSRVGLFQIWDMDWFAQNSTISTITIV